MKSQKEIDDKISKLTSEIDELKRQAQEMREAEKDPLKLLTEKLHGVLCGLNHTDGCGWYYEIQKDVHNWGGYEHKHWLDKARKLQEICGANGIEPDKALEIFKMVKGV